VDAAARRVLIDAGFGAHILHRTGHSLGQEIHGNGVHMDDYETRDDRRLVPGLGFTIEPGLYFEDFGIRTEIDMTVGLKTATVTGDIQTEMERLG
jgi:Xaa-Pro dipeptidase